MKRCMCTAKDNFSATAALKSHVVIVIKSDCTL